MAPTVSIEEANRSPRKRWERDLQIAASLPDDEADAYLRHAQRYDRRARIREMREVDSAEADAADTRAGMLRRVDAVIAEIVDQHLGWQVVR